jgi:hypothetical protein
VNGTCECKDFTKAHSGWCKHRLAYGMFKRASALVKSKLAQFEGTETHQSVLPEAPASVNVHVTLHGRQIQVTLRDTNEQHLLERLEKLLERFPVEETQQEGWCRKHNLKMKEHHKDGRNWYAHKVGSIWCYGK